ncbi:nucleoside hydrolase [Salinicoccus sp. ID82-1]|uniref:Nucleoside hydrolase n=1 Tax=Salinicoccus cyprini TaxID=2493691 RepID=A0A558AYD7_9STAP|nr:MULTISPECIES: nucleoside hydrolase [Salinicoccus]MCG1008802.1 nucleoside hydrolase [Salinicoccus sp. ID82-1]TVT29281.1 nucleoside hydrolase [Salinicoccus cyprini]
MTARKVILDCDPGHDDAISIIIAASKMSNLEILGITTVAGNVEVQKNTTNALKVKDLLGLDVPVVQGAERPLVRKSEIATEIHGDSGMDGPVLPNPKSRVDDGHAVDFIVEQILQSEGKVTLVPTGPLTNIALALHKAPEIKHKIEEIVLMGGGTFGNWTPAAEFNIYVDAEAAKFVFESGIHVTMFGLDVTHQVIATKDIQQRLSKVDNRVGKFVSELLVFFGDMYEDHFGFEGGPIHDACTTMYLLKPELFDFKHVHLAVETKGEFTYGATAVDLLGVTGRIPNTHFAYQVDQEAFWDLFEAVLESYGEVA